MSVTEGNTGMSDRDELDASSTIARMRHWYDSVPLEAAEVLDVSKVAPLWSTSQYKYKMDMLTYKFF